MDISGTRQELTGKTGEDETVCGIAGILYKDGELHELGQALISMLDGCQHRGPDSTGFALYHDMNGAPSGHHLRLRFFVGANGASQQTLARIREKLEEL